MNRIVICGGGVAGLCAALALQAKGIESIVLEQRNGEDEIGAGIQLAPNATRCFRMLGVEPHLRAAALEPGAVEILDADSGTLAYQIPLGESLGKLYGAPYLVMHRGDLLDVLRQQLKNPPLHKQVAGFEEQRESIAARCTDGSAVEGDYLLGADGVGSIIRKQLFPQRAAPLSGRHAAWRAQVDDNAAVPDNNVRAWCSRGCHLVAYRLPDTARGKGRVNLVALAQEDKRPPVESWLKGLPELSWKKYTLFESGIPERFSRGRAGLLGDAAHPMLPFLAQGAGMAVEDAVALAQSFGKGEGLRGLDALCRLQRLRRVRRAILFQGRIFHRQGFWGRLAWSRTATSLARLAPQQLRDTRLGWLYKGGSFRGRDASNHDRSVF